MSQTSVLDDQLKIAAASLRSYRRKGDVTLISFWQTQVDRLLDQLNDLNKVDQTSQERDSVGIAVLPGDGHLQGLDL
ncbi:hypothetical protein FZI85_17335 [Mycobacterium sp. CBMA293]|uniref:hypothetical protein n=1 Tax=unclassified Mycolicibacterium TaxID=2636767 RepID=UPI0012DD3E91|nr:MULTISPECIES: hypothetical protein [unclassified Mycolicibacterium]MUL44486.1 hypothetical protein [Mycolicibacterium sp. CBMA 360]MUL59806.1 hypothetical protein [Mycolicibacterium sp. CBMA 335]MUL68649.1 hypothetical protein [Mycolicibacterium sp. CBMA 311]MUL93960.1 hypothetical protein [Mycolicibacterium sp. CBMA 230]MUM06206.1 hypothetical protein [Mycolicibacterium sp. CBMA 213]